MFRKLTLILLAVLVTIVVVAVTQYQRWQNAPLPIDTAGQVIEVPAGLPLDRLAEQLKANGIIEHAWDLKLLARLQRDAGNVQAGEYELEPGITLAGLLEKLVAGRVKLHSLTVVEGTTLAQLLRQLEAHPGIVPTLDTKSPVAIADALELPTEHAEGWFLPETYHFPRGTTDIAFLRRAYRAMRTVLDDAWAKRAERIPIDSAYEALILASIIEKETAVESERGEIAGVFTRRLEKGMRLQTDPTVIYGLGDAYKGDIRYRHLRTDTPYNTYTRAGLPPTPIALPSRESILAAVNPEPGDSLYFVARGPGREHVFSATLEAHNRAVQQYQKQRRALDENPEGSAQ